MNILIVDDSALMRGIIRRTIQDQGTSINAEIVEANDGAQALEAVGKGDVDLILVDWNMPVLDGLSFVKDLRGRGLQMPVIMVSAVSDEDKIYEACEAGVTDYVTKPVQGADLWQRIKDYVK